MLETPTNVHPSNGEVYHDSDENFSFQLKGDNVSFITGEMYDTNGDTKIGQWTAHNDVVNNNEYYNNDVITSNPFWVTSSQGIDIEKCGFDDFKYRYRMFQSMSGLEDAPLQKVWIYNKEFDLRAFHGVLSGSTSEVLYRHKAANPGQSDNLYNYIYCIQLEDIPPEYLNNLYRFGVQGANPVAYDAGYGYNPGGGTQQVQFYKYYGVIHIEYDGSSVNVPIINYNASNKEIYFDKTINWYGAGTTDIYTRVKNILDAASGEAEYTIYLNRYIRKPTNYFGRCVLSNPFYGSSSIDIKAQQDRCGGAIAFMISHNIVGFQKPYQNNNESAKGNDVKQDSKIIGNLWAEVTYRYTSNSKDYYYKDTRRVVDYYEAYKKSVNNTQYFIILDFPFNNLNYSMTNVVVDLYTDYITTPWYDFKLREEPTSTLTLARCNGGFRSQATYHQNQFVDLKSYQMEACDSNDEVKQSTGNVYSRRLDTKFLLPMSNNTYASHTNILTQENDALTKTQHISWDNCTDDLLQSVTTEQHNKDMSISITPIFDTKIYDKDVPYHVFRKTLKDDGDASPDGKYIDVLGDDLLSGVTINGNTDIPDEEPEDAPFDDENYDYVNVTKTVSGGNVLSDVIELLNGTYRFTADKKSNFYVYLYDPYNGYYDWIEYINSSSWETSGDKFICNIEIKTEYEHNYVRVGCPTIISNWNKYGLVLRSVTQRFVDNIDSTDDFLYIGSFTHQSIDILANSTITHNKKPVTPETQSSTQNYDKIEDTETKEGSVLSGIIELPMGTYKLSCDDNAVTFIYRYNPYRGGYYYVNPGRSSFTYNPDSGKYEYIYNNNLDVLEDYEHIYIRVGKNMQDKTVEMTGENILTNISTRDDVMPNMFSAESAPFDTPNYDSSYLSATELSENRMISEPVDLPNGRYAITLSHGMDVTLWIYNPYTRCYDSSEGYGNNSHTSSTWDFELNTSNEHNYIVVDYGTKTWLQRKQGVSICPILHASIETITKWEDTGIKLESIEPNTEVLLTDYTAGNNQKYKYQIEYYREDKPDSAYNTKYTITDVVTTNWDGWSISGLKLEDNTNEFYTTYNITQTWNFVAGIDGGSIVTNTSRVASIGAYQYAQFSNDNNFYESGTFTANLLELQCPDNTMIDDIKRVKEWNKFIYNHSAFLLKSDKGDVWVVSIVNNPTRQYEDYIGLPTIVSYDWVEIDDINKVIIK